MRDPLVAHSLAESAELPALEMIAGAALVMKRALYAAHPELRWGPFLGELPGVTPRHCLAAGIVSALDALTAAVELYFSHDAACGLAEEDEPDPDPQRRF